MDKDKNIEDKLKDTIKNLFPNKDEVKAPAEKKKRPGIPPQIKKAKPVFSTTEEQTLTEEALDELESIRQLFLIFQDDASEYPVYQYIESDIHQFSMVLQDIMDLLENKVNPEVLDEASKVRYEKLQEKRLEMLQMIKDQNLGE